MPVAHLGDSEGVQANKMFAIRHEHIHRDKKSIYIPEAKGGARVQPITDQLADYLAEYLQTVPQD